jgi:hypothetical protein
MLSEIGDTGICCWSRCSRELVFAAMVADARSQEMLHQADETSASITMSECKAFAWRPGGTAIANPPLTAGNSSHRSALAILLQS